VGACFDPALDGQPVRVTGGHEEVRWFGLNDSFDRSRLNSPSASALTMPSTLARLRAGLHPLDRPPIDGGWNQAELIDLLPASVRLVEAAVLVGLV
jgi:hypothetical protein